MNQVASNMSDANTDRADARYRLAARIALVAAVFSLIVAAVLLYDFSRRTVKDPSEAPALVALKAALKTQPTSEELKKQIRVLDLEVREEYARQRTLATGGAILLCCGVIVFLIAAKVATVTRQKLPMPRPLAGPQDIQSRWTAAARWGVAGLFVSLAVIAVALGVLMPNRLPQATEEAVTTIESKPSVTVAAPAAYVPSAEEIRTAWSRFRGPNGSGHLAVYQCSGYMGRGVRQEHPLEDSRPASGQQFAGRLWPPRIPFRRR